MKPPFPNEFRGRYCQLSATDVKRFIELHAYEYDIEDINRLKKLGVLNQSEIYKLSNLYQGSIPKSTEYLFKLETYLNDLITDDQWLFNEAIIDYEVYVFISIEELIFYCKKRWNIDEKKFCPIDETDIPH